MSSPQLTPEQHEHLASHVATIGHNRGPALIEHQEEILERAARHHRLRAELTGIRVMFDMLRSDVQGEYVLPAKTVAYISVGIGLVAAITGFSIVAEPLGAVLLDAVVVSFIISALRGELEQYVDWRAARDPLYAAGKRELYGDKKA
jgi:hypothetical protein